MDEWPALPFEEWRETRDTLHMYTQVVGKLRLALSPFEPQWANVPLYLTARGLTTSPLPYGGRTFDAEFDLLGHELVMRTSTGQTERVALRPRPVADFYQDVMSALGRVDVNVTISATPSEVADPIPFAEDRTHETYDPAQVTRFFHVLSRVDVVFKEYRARFIGKTPPVHFFWGSFDLAVTRFSGRPVTPPADAGVIVRYGGDAEQICAGFWPGHDKSPIRPSSHTPTRNPMASRLRPSARRRRPGTTTWASSSFRTTPSARIRTRDAPCWTSSSQRTMPARRGSDGTPASFMASGPDSCRHAIEGTARLQADQG
jgi:hypothetical protein